MLPLALVLALFGCGRVAFDDVVGDDSGLAADDSAAGTGLSDISATFEHTCAIIDGALWCFGQGMYGQIGDGTMSALNLSPKRVPGTWRAVQTGENHTCAIAIDDGVWCWGVNDRGQVGVAGADRPSPVQVQLTATPRVVEISASYNHTCVRRDDDSLACWGRNAEGELGLDDDGSVTSYAMATFPAIGPGFSAMDAGFGMTIGLRGGQIYGTGRNFDNQIGLGTGALVQYRTFEAAAVGPWLAVDNGQNGSCGIRDDHTLWCWGANDMYQLGTGDTVSTAVPVLIDNAHAWSAVDLNTFGGCGIVDGGQLMCWGRNVEGQLGTDSGGAPFTVPMLSAPFTDVVHVAAGRFHTCLQRSDQTVWCTGDADSGKLGQGDQLRLYAWTQVPL